MANKLTILDPVSIELISTLKDYLYDKIYRYSDKNIEEIIYTLNLDNDKKSIKTLKKLKKRIKEDLQEARYKIIFNTILIEEKVDSIRRIVEPKYVEEIKEKKGKIFNNVNTDNIESVIDAVKENLIKEVLHNIQSEADSIEQLKLEIEDYSVDIDRYITCINLIDLIIRRIKTNNKYNLEE